MGDFDAVISTYFKSTPEGRRLFFPRGHLGRGYAIASERALLGASVKSPTTATSYDDEFEPSNRDHTT